VGKGYRKKKKTTSEEKTQTQLTSTVENHGQTKKKLLAKYFYGGVRLGKGDKFVREGKKLSVGRVSGSHGVTRISLGQRRWRRWVRPEVPTKGERGFHTPKRTINA